ncbi:kinetochore protein NDC80 homolog [Discoglossus pictus]
MEPRPNGKRPFSPNRPSERSHLRSCPRISRVQHCENCSKEARKRKYPKPETVSLQECVRLLRQITAEDTCPQKMPKRRTQESSRDAHSTFSFVYTSLCPGLPNTRCEEEIHGTMRRCGHPCQLSENSMCSVHSRPQSVTALTLLREVLKLIFALEDPVSHEGCREHTCEPDMKKYSGCFITGADVQQQEPDVDLSFDSCQENDYWDQPLHGNLADMECESEHDQVCFTSNMKLNNSLKTDLQLHQIFLANLKSRLAILEEQSEDFTRHLEKANIELEALKQRNPDLTRHDAHQTCHKGFLDEVELDIWELQEGCKKRLAPLWMEGLEEDQIEYPPAETHKCSPKLRKTTRRRSQCSSASNSQDKFDVLMQKVNKQIDQIENEITSTTKKKKAVNKKMEEVITEDTGKPWRGSDSYPMDLWNLQELLNSKLKAEDVSFAWD